MEMIVKIDSKDFVEPYCRVDLFGNEIRCKECGRIVIHCGNFPPFAKVIFNLAKHEHGHDTPN